MALDMKKLFGGGMMGRMPKSVSIKSVSMEHGPDDASEEGDERVSAAQAIIKAVRANDPEALDMALEDHYRACEESKEPSDSEGADDSGSEDDPGDHEYR